TACPLYPRKRTLVKRAAMSALCQNRIDGGETVISSAQLRIRLAAVKSSSALLYSGTISYSAQRDISSSRLSHWMASSSSLVNSAKHLGLPICVTGLWVPSAKATVWATFGAWTYFKNSSASGERSGLLTVEVISIHATPPLPSIGPFSGVMERICG